MQQTETTCTDEQTPTISVVIPTLRRPDEVEGVLKNICRQSALPYEVILVDGAPPDEIETEAVVESLRAQLPFTCRYIRHAKGTAIQRNAGIDAARGEYIAFIDDDIRLEPDFLERMLDAFASDVDNKVGGIVGYRVNDDFKLESRLRWRWYRRLRLLSTFEPGRYDFNSGYPINVLMQPPFTGVRPVDFTSIGCSMWRRQVMAGGLRFHSFFRDFGVLEDAHFSLMAGRNWTLWHCGDAHCVHDQSPHGRVNSRRIGYKCVVNYYFVFRDIAGPLSLRQRYRFWKFQLFELLRVASSAIRRRRWSDVCEVIGRLEGFLGVARGETRVAS